MNYLIIAFVFINIAEKGFNDEITYCRPSGCSCSSCGASCCFITPAFAGNVGKTSWSAYLTGWNTADTPNRQKQDASNGYIKADHVSGDRTIRAWMLGYANEDVESGVVTLTSGQEGWVINQVYKNFGKKQVHMRLQAAHAYSGATETSGKWSPDN